MQAAAAPPQKGKNTEIKLETWQTSKDFFAFSFTLLYFSRLNKITTVVLLELVQRGIQQLNKNKCHHYTEAGADQKRTGAATLETRDNVVL